MGTDCSLPDHAEANPPHSPHQVGNSCTHPLPAALRCPPPLDLLPQPQDASEQLHNHSMTLQGGGEVKVYQGHVGASQRELRVLAEVVHNW